MRDYDKEPLKIIVGKGCYEDLPYDDLYQMYVIDNMSLDSIGKKVGVSRKVVKKWVDGYGLERGLSKTDLIKKTCLEKYGKESFKRLGYSDTTVDILDDKVLLERYIKENCIASGTDLAQRLGISNAVARRKIVEYHLKSLLNHHSMVEKELETLVSSHYSMIANDRTMIDGKEIDIYIPELKLGIEYNGNYWHNEEHLPKKYHQDKSLMAESKGIFIYHIFEYEWKNKKKQILNQLNNLLKLNDRKIGARECEIFVPSVEEKKKFLEINHLQGNDRASVCYGLKYNDEMVSLMTFCKPRFNKKYEWELSRFCSLSGCNVIGGADKLFRRFVEEYCPKTIVSYSNIAHTRGNLYEKLGFRFDTISCPNYVWQRSETVLTRYQCQKHKLLDKGLIGVSEVEIMHKLGYQRIYDCGNKVWVWQN